jgi:homoserine O-acetyltransferase
MDHPAPDATVDADSGEVGLVAPQDLFTDEPFAFELGGEVPGFTQRYETYGRINDERSNAVLICHAWSGDHHCAGINRLDDRKAGWWNNLIGPGKPIDTSRFFVICANCIGGCSGTTGPGSTNPATGKPWGLTFPQVTIGDMVRGQLRLLDHLGIERLHAAVGGSMGGMQVLELALSHPERVRRILPMATTARAGAQAIAFNEVGRRAILQDPNWGDGSYLPGEGPKSGLAVARMMAHITFLSDQGMDQKFGRNRRSDTGDPFGVEFEVESYLRYQGQAFVDRFDARTYLYFTRSLDRFDLAARAGGDLTAAVEPMSARALILGFSSDWLYPPRQNRALVEAMLRAGKDASYAEIELDAGHDSFLVHSEDLYTLTRDFLER